MDESRNKELIAVLEFAQEKISRIRGGSLQSLTASSCLLYLIAVLHEDDVDQLLKLNLVLADLGLQGFERNVKAASEGLRELIKKEKEKGCLKEHTKEDES